MPVPVPVPVPASPPASPPTVGALAPDFTATVYHADPLQLSSLRGGKVWLAFFRYGGCPLCNLRVHEMIERYPEWARRGLSIVAVIQSPVEEVERTIARQQPPFPLVCDPDEALYRLYGAGSSVAGYLSLRNMPRIAKALRGGFGPGPMHGTKTRLPADFLLDEQGVIRDAFHAEVISEHIPFERVDAFLAATSDPP